MVWLIVFVVLIVFVLMALAGFVDMEKLNKKELDLLEKEEERIDYI